MKYELFSRQEYFDYLTEYFNKAGKNDRLILASMEFWPHQIAIAQLVDAMCKAAERGANTTFLVDAYSFMLKDGSVPGPMFFTKKDLKKGYGYFKIVIDSVKKMEDSGVKCVVLNKPIRPLKNPFGGRSHIKFAVINNHSFIGGCNLSSPEQLDLMVKTDNKLLADYLEDFTADVARIKNVRKALEMRDKNFRIDEHTELLIDSGVKRQSLIYERAFELIKNASSKVYMTCQYFPNNVTPAALTKAYKRGVGVHLAYNHPSQHNSLIRPIQEQTVAFKKKYMPLSFFENQLDEDKNYLHAKILLSESEAIIGSHNFVKMGVNLGTAEMALHSTSPEFIKSARNWITSL